MSDSLLHQEFIREEYISRLEINFSGTLLVFYLYNTFPQSFIAKGTWVYRLKFLTFGQLHIVMQSILYRRVSINLLFYIIHFICITFFIAYIYIWKWIHAVIVVHFLAYYFSIIPKTGTYEKIRLSKDLQNYTHGSFVFPFRWYFKGFWKYLNNFVVHF